MPTIAYWPKKIEKGVSNSLLSQIDLYASFASLVEQKITENEAPDSQDLLLTWIGKSKKGRDVLLEESLVVSIRKGKWKYIPETDKNTDYWLLQKGIEGGFQKTPQLFNLIDDSGFFNIEKA